MHDQRDLVVTSSGRGGRGVALDVRATGAAATQIAVEPRLHPDEVPIDTALVRRLLAGQLPELSGLPLRAVPNQGTDNLVFRLGAELAVRLPRKSGAVAALLREQRWLPEVAPQLPLAVPVPVAAGQPDDGYPFPWLVCRWVPGEPARPRNLDPGDARRLADFVAALQAVEPAGGPPVEPGARAGPVPAYDRTARTALAAVAALRSAGRIEPDLVDPARAEQVWADGLAAPPWPGAGVWVHRDLYFGNLLTIEGRLSGVIDFGGLAVGDPAGDVMGAFHMFGPGRPPGVRRNRRGGPATWARARAWTLVMALEALPYYLDTHPGMVTMAHRAVAAALAPDP